MNPIKCPIIAVTNNKGGVGKTTTAINLAQALAMQDLKVLLVDLDPQGNATQGLGVHLDTVSKSVADLIQNRDIPTEAAIYKGDGFDLIAATPLLDSVEREMVGRTNSELRLRNRLFAIRDRYDFILIDTSPGFGPLLNSALNAADFLIIPVDSAYFALMGIKKLQSEVDEIRQGMNPNLKVLGYLLTISDPTNMTTQTLESMHANFGDLVFETKIRRSVKLREAPSLGRTVFHHAPESSAAKDYYACSEEVLSRLSQFRDVSKPISHGLRLVNSATVGSTL